MTNSGLAPKRRYGWKRDLPDYRDFRYAVSEHLTQLPAKVDLTSDCPAVYDQGELGSCTANATAGAHEFDQLKQRLPHPFTPSRLFIYFNERQIEGTTQTDSGARIRDGIKSIARQGVCPETLWPYVVKKFADRPGEMCYQKALGHRAILYQAVPQDLAHMKGCLAEGYPWVFGFTVYQSFESQAVAQTGIVPMPEPNEPVLGGHAVVAVGYDDAAGARGAFIVRNSWGPQWGQAGYCLIPYAYLINSSLASDFWTVRSVK